MRPGTTKVEHAWIAAWKGAGAALKAVKKDDLRSFNYAENASQIDEMLQWAVEHRRLRTTSGLVEQQRFFNRMRGRLSTDASVGPRNQEE